MRLYDKSQHFQSSYNMETEKVKSGAETIMPAAGNGPTHTHYTGRHQELPSPVHLEVTNPSLLPSKAVEEET